MQASNINNTERQLPLITGLLFTIMGDGKNVFRGNSNSMSRSNLTFETETSLCPGMLLQVKLAVAAGKSLGLQAMVKVIAINRISGSDGYQVNSFIEDMTLKI